MILSNFSNAQIKIFVTDVDSGYSKTSVNTAIFRQSALTTCGDTQFIAFYDKDLKLVLGKRAINKNGVNNEKFLLKKTSLKMFHANDAHNVISIAVDGDGFLHLAYDHHNTPLKYLKSVAPYSLDLEMAKMIPNDYKKEKDVTYPEFYNFSNGDLLFVYRNLNNMIMNYYDTKNKKWTRLYDNLFENDALLRPYWQMYVDENDCIHISWLWRSKGWEPATNNGIYYVKSSDYGKTWQQLFDSTSITPIFTRLNVKKIIDIPEKSNLINQTSMSSDSKGNVYIATYFNTKTDSITNYHLIVYNNKTIKDITLGHRKTNFSLQGMGTLMIPICRPKVVVSQKKVFVFFRDEELDSRIAVYYSKKKKMSEKSFKLAFLTLDNFGAWEPCIDSQLLKKYGKINLFVQKTFQKSGDKIVESAPTMIKVMEIGN